MHPDLHLDTSVTLIESGILPLPVTGTRYGAAHEEASLNEVASPSRLSSSTFFTA